MSARRALEFSTPGSAKRRKNTPGVTSVIYRGVRPEMKAADYPVTHTSTTAFNLHMTGLAQGTGVFERIGNKVKVWRIEGIVKADVPVRIQILAPNDAKTAPFNTNDKLFNYRSDRLLAEYVLDAQVANSWKHVNYKLPLGQNAVYNGSVSGSIVKGSIYVRLLTAASTTLGGEFRIYYTDS